MRRSTRFHSRKLILILILILGGISASALSRSETILGYVSESLFSTNLISTNPTETGSILLVPPPTPIPITLIDDNGADDEPNQKDLNFLTVNYAPPTPGTINVIWGWDDTATSGANTLDACSLFDTDDDGFANYSFCMIINSDNSYSSVLYSCGDGATDRCTNPRSPVDGATSSGTYSRPADSDPFGVVGSPYFTSSHLAGNACKDGPGCNTIDTVANTDILLSEVGGGEAFLLNVCSYPSGIPGSDPSDCVVTPNSGFLTIVKIADPDDTTTFTINASSGSQSGDSSWAFTGSETRSLISYAPTTTLDLTEVVPEGWELDSASCVLNGNPTGSPTATGVDNFTIQAGLETVCTFNNSLAQGTLKLVKAVDNLGNSGPDYKGVSDFPLAIDGTATTSGAVVTVAAGDHTISETAQFGYDVGTWSCNDGTFGTLGSVSATVNVASGEDVICTMTNTVNDDILNPQLSIVKDDNGATFDSAGDVITYSITATNTGNTNLTGVTITDALATLGECTPANGSPLAPGEFITCSATYTITQADVDFGSYLNTACVDDDIIGTGGAAQACDDESTPGSKNPELSIEKTSSTASYDSVGDVITYSITATNTGNVTLSSVLITDEEAVLGTCNPANGSTLAPGESITCSATHTVTQEDIDAGTYNNTACVDDGTNGAARMCDDADVPATQTPALTIEKTSSTQSYSAVGEVITYSITATNSGNVTLASVTITDEEADLGTCNPANGSELAPGQSITCSATHVVTQADIDAGTYNNTACVDDGPNGAAQACDDVDVPASQNPHLSITKVASEENFDQVGDVISYTITATNDGNVTLGSVTVSDPLVSGLVCSPVNGSPLSPGQSMVCTASHTVTQADLDAGHFANTACVDDGAGGATEACDDEDVPGLQNPALSITKEATESGYDSVGDIIHYTIVATNTGNVTLTNVSIVDAQVLDLSCDPGNPTATLAPGSSITCTASHTITQADLDAGSFYNQACVDYGMTRAVGTCDDVTTPGTQNPHLSITKTADPASFDSVGDVINYIIVATNDGNVTLNSVTVSDPNVSDLLCTPANGSSLAPGESLTCTASHTITQDDLDAGHYANTSCVDDGAGGALEACDNEDVPGLQNPHLSIVKGDNNATYDSVGDVITYSITATNDGNVTLHNVTITDPNAVLGTCNPINGSTLAPGETITCSATHEVTQGDIDAGSYLNTACVDDGEEGAAEACDEESTPGTQNPSLSITKTDDGSTFDSVGDIINYTIVATNNGNVTLSNVVVTDPNADGLLCTPANGSTLAPGESLNCTASHTVTQADIDAGSYNNAACVDDGEEGAAEACDDVTTPGDKNPHLTVTKTDDGETYSAVGDVINYTIVATNDGNVTLPVVTVTDPNAENLVCTPANGSSLAPGESMNCTASHTVTQADINAGSYYNQACADDGPNGAAQACDDVTTPGSGTPAITLVKTANPSFSTPPVAGDTIAYTFVIKNAGNVTLTGVDLTDSLFGYTDITCGLTTLEPGEETQCSATYTLSQADVDAGSVSNTATACGDPPTGGEVCDDDETTTPVAQTKTIDLEKSAVPSFGNPPVPGNTINYSFVITNTGNVTLTGVDLSDALVGFSDATCGTTTLLPGASTNCSAIYGLTQTDINTGSVSNSATACGDPPSGSEVCDTDGTTTPIGQAPSLSVDKSADTTLITGDGQVITYTYVITNTGNITLTGVTLADDRLGSIFCPQTTLNPGAFMTCTATYTVQAGDFSSTSLTNVATADSDQTGPATDTVTIPIQPPIKGHIMHTGVTCSDFLSENPSDELERADYGVKSGKVNNVAPGVMFYYGSITAPSSSITYILTQTNDQNWKPIPAQSTGQIILYTANCNKVNATSTYNATTGTATIVANGLTAGSTYVVGAKYSLSGVAGQPVSSPYPIVTYSFSATLNGNPMISSGDSIVIYPRP